MKDNKKLNLSAIMKNKNENQDTNIKTSNPEILHTPIKAGVKINIDSIKAEKKEIPNTSKIKETKVSKEKKGAQSLLYESLTSKVISNTKKMESSKQDTNENKDNSITLIENTKNSEKQQSTNILEEIDGIQSQKKSNNSENIKENQGKSSDLFLNYESEYKKKESIIIHTIHKLKKIADLKKLTKTNKVFVSSIIITTILGLSFIFYIDPETHSYENYKTSLLTLAGRKITQSELQAHEINIQKEITWKLNQNNLGGYSLDFEILTDKNGKILYRFDKEQYNSKQELDTAIQKKLDILKREKIKNYIKNTQFIEDFPL